MLIPVEGEKSLSRDSKTNAIVNTNKSDYEAYIRQRDSKNDEKERVNRIESDLSELKSDINEIKDLLRKLTV
jgi:hypothetical protein|tara:strand:- start:13 stop:228 length:216 start_codon:yes stop_codon:yes gene_type:complete